MIKTTMALMVSIMFAAVTIFAQEKAAEPEKKVEKPMAKNPLVQIETNMGSFYLEVFQNETPIHAKNFLSKVDAGKYDSLTFHRIVPGFVIQGGDPTGTGTGSMGNERLADEKSPFREVRGTVAMARSQLGASNCQFYVNLKDNLGLDMQGFSAFAKVVQGMDVVDKISKVKTDPSEKPIEPVVMLKVLRVDKLPAAVVAPTPAPAPDKK